MSSDITLQQLARAYGVQTAYRDITGQRRVASREALLAVLQVLGARIRRPEQAERAWRDRAEELWRQLADPVAVAWQGTPAVLGLRLRAGDTRVELELTLEQGERRRWTTSAASLKVLAAAELGNRRFVERELPLPLSLPPGYHELRIKAGRRQQLTLVISAPRQVYAGEQDPGALWGVFAPIYAIRSSDDWGCGDYTQLERLGRWIAELGGGMVATLPFCCSFLDTLFAPSPYSPASRLFWNELYVDPRRAPNLERCAEARRLMQRIDARELPALRRSRHVDYRASWAAKRRVLEPLARSFFADAEGRDHDDFVDFVESRPAVEDYARFRAATEQMGRPWHTWPAEARDGRLRPGDWDSASERFHLYVQWLADRQIDALSESARQRGPGLYVDLPLGVHDCGYDAWRHQGLFPLAINVGAPPDALFTGGQDWGFPPLHPLRSRAEHHRHLIDYVGNITRKAGILRVDHVMGLHRLFWIPKGMEVRHGVYVRYPADELYAILAVESHRNRCLIVGENLGTVPGYVNRAMRRHRIHGMYVMQFELGGDAPKPPRRHAVASLNTHDTPPFAGFWRGRDIDQRRELGLIEDEAERRERAQRRGEQERLRAFLLGKGWLNPGSDEQDVLGGCLSFLGSSAARMVLVNLEDLWLEQEPQNVPGIGDDRLPNWRRKLALDLRQARRHGPALASLERLHRARNPEGDDL